MDRFHVAQCQPTNAPNDPPTLIFSRWSASLYPRNKDRPDWTRLNATHQTALAEIWLTPTPSMDQIYRVTVAGKQALLDTVESPALIQQSASNSSSSQVDTDAYLQSIHTAITTAGQGGDLDVQVSLDADHADLLFKSVVGGLKIILGRLQLHRVTDDQLSVERGALMTHWLANEQQVQKRMELLQVRMKDVMVQKNQAMSQVDEMVSAKQEMETALFQKFALVLNAKKERIRELEQQLMSKSSHKKGVDKVNDDDEVASDTGGAGAKKTAGRKKAATATTKTKGKGKAPAKKRSRKAVAVSDDDETTSE